jgi:hypothetical protein
MGTVTVKRTKTAPQVGSGVRLTRTHYAAEVDKTNGNVSRWVDEQEEGKVPEAAGRFDSDLVPKIHKRYHNRANTGKVTVCDDQGKEIAHARESGEVISMDLATGGMGAGPGGGFVMVPVAEFQKWQEGQAKGKGGAKSAAVDPDAPDQPTDIPPDEDDGDEEEHHDLKEMTKEELVDCAKAEGVEVHSADTKAEITKKIKKARKAK